MIQKQHGIAKNLGYIEEQQRFSKGARTIVRLKGPKNLYEHLKLFFQNLAHLDILLGILCLYGSYVLTADSKISVCSF